MIYEMYCTYETHKIERVGAKRWGRSRQVKILRGAVERPWLELFSDILHVGLIMFGVPIPQSLLERKRDNVQFSVVTDFLQIFDG